MGRRKPRQNGPSLNEGSSTERGIGAINLSLSYGGDPVVVDATLRIPSAAFTAIIGPNGSGKSTILRAVSRLLEPTDGAIYIDGVSVATLSTREIARRVGLLPQSATHSDRITVAELAALGRHPHQHVLNRWTQEDEESVRSALAATALTGLADRSVDQLSGGQRQRAWIAMTLAQRTPIVLLDEPTTHLDPAAQFDVLDLCRELVHGGTTVVAVLHDINQAFRYADWVVAMKEGRLVTTGTPEQLATANTMTEVFDIVYRSVTDSELSRPHLIPVRRVP